MTDNRSSTLDANDPLAGYRDRFFRADDVRAYLDGNSLGRPTKASAERLSSFVTEEWGTQLIRGWDDGWYELPLTVGDEIGAVTLGAASGQVFIGDSTTVILYKLIRAAIDARPDRNDIIVDTDNFPTDRFILQGIAAECGKTLRWVTPDPDAGVTPEQVAEVLGPDTALVVLSHVAYRSGYLADAQAITALAHEAGALVLWDLCHSVGSVPVQLDAWGVDLAAGCTYKYLNGGPGSPAFGYVRTEHQEAFRQPIQGWMGTSEPFTMGPEYEPHHGIRRFLSGTPSVIGMLAIQDMLAIVAEAGMDAIRAKSERLTAFAIDLVDDLLIPRGVALSSPRDPSRRGSHVTVDHESFAEVNARLWAKGIIPDFRRPHGLRLGLSPLTTSFEELEIGVEAIAAELP
ncbi:kynureninase [Cryobacterium mesophilum]|uniref:Kynureninase n=1 Tax=Terrimesophilobacter mesophilus TaxID=433647 RepID=A0A4V3I9M3_9MICO|nr:aminotransferase class V-fold PLP-dependent enzyme [Terrimesophilobacter mesophilus]MBB5633265.1 kynureninase [Terrimesophilobacter mesophilus]TFB80008.1 aminotransferase class V-fold PLP-dependent enzyme [Terrimesophilobacter mesophilus]